MNVAIIQARMNSKRLPGKVLKKIMYKTVLEHVIERVSFSKKLDLIIVATGNPYTNKKIIKLCNKYGILVYSGEDNNVLKRYYDLIEKIKLKDEDNVIRITADCPLIDGNIIDNMLKKDFEEYIGNQNNMIDGFDIEIIKAKKLREIYNKYKFDEHVTLEWKKSNPKMEYYYYDSIKRNDIHLSLDTKEDFKKIKKIFKYLSKKNLEFKYNDIINYLGIK